MHWQTELVYFAHILLAVILGGLVGFERETAGKPAGLRTHMLVCAASAFFVVSGIAITDYFAKRFDNDVVMADPVRVIQAIAVGVSFIGAGTIIQIEKQERVKNLTTAASILYVAALGVAVAIGDYVLAVGAAILAVIVNRSVQVFEEKFLKKGDTEQRKDEVSKE